MERFLHSQPSYLESSMKRCNMLTRKTLYACAGIMAICMMVFSACASNSSSGNSGGSTLKTGPGVDVAKKTITLGILSPYSGPVAAPVGDPLAKGVEVFFDHVNDNGGINGFKVQFLEEDTQYNPQIEVQKYNQIHDKVLMIADSLGTPHFRHQRPGRFRSYAGIGSNACFLPCAREIPDSRRNPLQATGRKCFRLRGEQAG